MRLSELVWFLHDVVVCLLLHALLLSFSTNYFEEPEATSSPALYLPVVFLALGNY